MRGSPFFEDGEVGVPSGLDARKIFAWLSAEAFIQELERPTGIVCVLLLVHVGVVELHHEVVVVDAFDE